MVKEQEFLQRYKFLKEQTLRMAHQVENYLEGIPHNLELLYENLKQKMHRLKNEEFLIAVAGEVKAGKSTFVNSILKEEILPYDVLQSTSSIIEVYYSKKPQLKITYASGRIESYTEESKEIFKDILRRVASIPDKYRDIPITLIEQYFLDFKEKPEINENYIRYLEEKSGLPNLMELKDKIIEFTNQLSLDKIPIRIELGYPFPWEFEGLRIVDMPGVNAIGGVQDVSFSFIEEANAILFIHPIKPVESESFQKFVSSIITKKSKKYLFLILTHAAVFLEEKDRLLEEAKRIYGSLIPSDRIFAVDSVLKLIYEDLVKGKSPQDIKSDIHKRKWYILFKDLAEADGKELAPYLLEQSGFIELIPVLEKFLIDTPLQELEDFIDLLIDFYNEFILFLEENIKFLNEQKKDPETFVKEIELRQKGLEAFESQSFLVLEEAYINFMGTNSPLEKSINEIRHKYYEIFSNIDNIEELRKAYRDAENDLIETVEKDQRQINIFFKERLSKLGENIVDEYKIRIPKIDLSAIEELSKQKALRKEMIYKEEVEGFFEKWNFLKPWKWLKSSRTHLVVVGDKVVFDQQVFINSLKNTLINEFTNTIESLRDEFYRAFNFYKEKIADIIRDKKQWLERLKKELKNIEKIEHDIINYQKKIAIIENEIKKAKMLKEELKC